MADATRTALESPFRALPGLPQPVSAAQPGAKRRVLLVDDHPITRVGVRQLVNQQISLEVCGEADSAESAVELARVLQPDVAIVDISLPSADGIELTRTLRNCAPRIVILILSLHDEVLYAEESMRAGAQGYLAKTDASEKIAVALEHLLRGDTYFSRSVKQKMLHALTRKRRRAHASDLAIDTLSAREREVLWMMGNGYNPVEIAGRLGLSRKTIDAYREHLRRKLGFDESGELSRYAIQRCRPAKARKLRRNPPRES